MAIQLEFLSLIIPLEKIDQNYPGGFEAFRSENEKGIMYDDYIVREGAMSSWDIESLVKKWESFGLIPIIKENGRMKWKDMCVVDYFGGPTLLCDWLKYEDEMITHVNDKTGKKILIIDRYAKP